MTYTLPMKTRAQKKKHGRPGKYMGTEKSVLHSPPRKTTNGKRVSLPPERFTLEYPKVKRRRMVKPVVKEKSVWERKVEELENELECLEAERNFLSDLLYNAMGILESIPQKSPLRTSFLKQVVGDLSPKIIAPMLGLDHKYVSKIQKQETRPLDEYFTCLVRFYLFLML